MAGLTLGPDHDLAIRLQKIEDAVKDLATRDVLQAANIGAGGLTVNGGNITIASGGSLIVTGTGTISLATGTFNANLITSNTDVNASGNFNAPNGTLVSPYARAHSVVTSYVAAYIDGSGNFLSTPSALRMKRDIRTATWTREQRDKIRVVFYRLRAAYILADMRGEDLSSVQTLAGVIGEELLAIGGFEEFVVMDQKHPERVFTVRYELLALIAIDGLQQAEARQDETDKEVRDLRQEVADLRALIESR